MTLSFTINAKDNNARTGVLTTKHGDIRTPAFMPVGTVGSVKALMTDQVRQAGADIILGNTYHLMLRPTAERVAKLGGLRAFMNWDGPILTDSGGFQVMSLAQLRKLSEEGVEFQSHIDGSKHMLSPERSMEIQHLLDATITMIFDECPAYPISYEGAKESMELSLRWAERSKQAYQAREGYGLFGIVQGSIFADLREVSAKALMDIGFDGYAVGGLAVGEGQQLMFDTLDVTCPHLPEDRPRYLMGVGRPDDIIGAVMRGIDMFDCVMPTRSGRNGQAFTSYGVVNIRNSRFADDPEPLDPKVDCPASRDYSRAYLHHLFKAKEMLGPMLLSWHNVSYYQHLMQEIREAISGGTLDEYAKHVQTYYAKG